MKSIAAFLLLFLVAASQAAPKRKIVGYHKPERMVCSLRYSNVESPWLSRILAWGVPLSVRYAASDDLPFGTRIYIPYPAYKKGRVVKKTLFRVIGDRPKYSVRGTRVEPYINRRYEPFFSHILQGRRTITIIKPIYARR